MLVWEIEFGGKPRPGFYRWVPAAMRVGKRRKGGTKVNEIQTGPSWPSDGRCNCHWPSRTRPQLAPLIHGTASCLGECLSERVSAARPPTAPLGSELSTALISALLDFFSASFSSLALWHAYLPHTRNFSPFPKYLIGKHT